MSAGKDGNSSVTSFAADMSLTQSHDPDIGQADQRSAGGSRRRSGGPDRLCGVCGDWAVSKNFGALTCETCKAFFRRNALKREGQQCVFGGQCVIEKTTRRFCPACRLQKCRDIGMMPQLIRFERTKPGGVKRTRNRLPGQETTQHNPDTQLSPSTHLPASPPASAYGTPPTVNSPGVTCISENSSVWPPSLDTFLSAGVTGSASPLAAELKPGHLNDHLNETEVQLSGDCELNPDHSNDTVAHLSGDCEPKADQSYDTEPQLPDPYQHPTYATHTDSPASFSLSKPAGQQEHGAETAGESSTGQHHGDTETDQGGRQYPHPHPHCCCHRSRLGLAEFQHVAREELPSDMTQYWLLRHEEREQLTHLSSVYQGVLATVGEEASGGHKVLDKPVSLEDYMFAMDKVFHWCVYFTKCIPHFQQLPQADQIATIKASIFLCHGIAMTTVFIPETKVWASILGQRTMDDIPPTLLPRDILEDIAEFCARLKMIAKNDFTVYALLHCIVLFDPRESNIGDRQRINVFRDEYTILLKHYLESQFSFQHADAYFSALMELVVKGGVRGRQAMHFVRQVAETTSEPLTAEILSVDKVAA